MRKFINFIKSYCYVRNDRFYKRLADLEKKIDCSKEIICIAERQQFLMRQLFLRQYMLDGAVEKTRKLVTAPLPESGGKTFLPVVFLTDEKYAYPTFVAVFSLLHRRDPETWYKVHVLGDRLSPQQEERFSLFGNQVEYRSVSPAARASVSHFYVSDTALLKFELPDLFPEWDKMLYLDSDILVRRDLAFLQKVEMEDVFLAAVLDPCITKKLRDNGSPGAKYFNSGVMLLNLAEMRRGNMPQKLKELKARERCRDFMDQDVLNAGCAGKFSELSPDCNYCGDNIFDNNFSLKELALIYGLDVETMRKIQESPALWHYSNVSKPWNSCRNLRGEEWLAEEVLSGAVFPGVSRML